MLNSSAAFFRWGLPGYTCAHSCSRSWCEHLISFYLCALNSHYSTWLESKLPIENYSYLYALLCSNRYQIGLNKLYKTTHSLYPPIFLRCTLWLVKNYTALDILLQLASMINSQSTKRKIWFKSVCNLSGSALEFSKGSKGFSNSRIHLHQHIKLQIL